MSSTKPRILVVGDAMLDQYWDGTVERISPEAPVPVLRIGGRRMVPGGAANVARNLVALGAEVTLLSLVGRDAAAAQLESLLSDAGVYLERVADAGYATTQKIRLVSRRQQLLRADVEARPPPGMLTILAQRFDALLPGHDILLLSDYAKGALHECHPFVRAATERGVPVLADPKGRDCSRFAGVTLLKPNLNEFRQWCSEFDGHEAFCDQASRLRQRLRVDHLLVTRGEQGMSLFSAGRAQHLPASVREVYDVSGAGDTVLATVACMMARGKPVDEAVHWAAVAAGIVVGKFGTATLSWAELEEAMHGQ